MSYPSWFDRGACKGMSLDLFYPAEKGLQEPPPKAKAVCDRCPVMAECLDHAVTRPEKHGVWGGTLPAQREAMREAMRS